MYTDKHIELLKARTKWDFDSATEFAKEHGFTPRSVVSKIGALGLVYQAKTKNPAPKAVKGPSKASLVAAVEAKIAIRLPSLDKMNIADLTILIDKIGA